MALRLAANLSFLFTDRPWEQRFAAAATCGFAGVELNAPLPYAASPARFASLLADEGLQCPLIVAPLGREKVAYGHACVPGEQSAFQASVSTMLDYAAAADIPLVHPSAGVVPQGVPRAEAEAIYVENIAWAASEAERAGRRLCIEPVSDIRASGFFLQTTAQALGLIARAGRPEIGLIFDTFHVEVQEGSASAALKTLLPRVAHVQVSDTPDRRTPGTGTIDFAAIFALLEAAQYSGWVGCEYTADGGSLSDFKWVSTWPHAWQAMPRSDTQSTMN